MRLQQPSTFSFGQTALPLLLVFVAAVAGFGGAHWLQARAEARAEDELLRAVQRLSHEIAQRLAKPAYALTSARALFARSAAFDGEAFATYANARQMPVELPGVRGLGFAQPVPHDVSTPRARGAQGFAVRALAPSTPPMPYVVREILPRERNPGLLGMDLASDAQRLDAIQRALLDDGPVTSALLPLAVDGRERSGLLVMLAIRTPDTPAAAHRGRVTGLVFAPIVLDELLSGLHEVEDGQLEVTLYDSASGQSDGPLMFAAAGASPARPHAARYALHTLVSLPDRPVTLQVRSTPAFEARFDGVAPPLFFWATFGAGLFVALLIRQQNGGRMRAERLAQRMTADLQRLALVARRTSNAVVITDVQRRITWVNDGFERVTGFRAAEVLGKVPGHILQCDQTDPATVRALRAALDAGQGFTGEILNRAQDGRHYWLSLEIQPLRDEDGSLTGFMAIELDITERKRAEAALRESQAFLDRTGELGQVGGWERDLVTQTVRWTAQTAVILGFEPGQVPALEQGLSVHTPAGRAEFERLTRRAIEYDEAFDTVLPLVRADGRQIVCRVVGRAEFEDGRARRLVGMLQDVTERHRLEEQLRDQGELLRNVIDNLPCGLSVFDDDGRLLIANRRMRELLELPAQVVDRPGVSFSDLAHYNAQRGEYGPGDPAALANAVIDRARGSARAHRFERTRPNGTVLDIRGGPMPGGGLVSTYLDITERRRAESDARQSWELLKGAISALDEAFVLYDAEDRLVLCNDRYKELYARVADLIKPGVRFEDLIRAGAQRGEYAEAIGRTEEWVAQRMARHRKADGVVIQPLANGRWVRIVERRLPDGHLVGFRIDITELVRAREQAEAASRASAQAVARLVAIYDVLPVGIMILDPSGRVLDTNPASQRLLGYQETTPQQIDLRTDGQPRFLREDGTPLPALEHPGARALREQRPVHDVVMQVAGQTGRGWLSVSAVPVAHDDLGVVVGYVDITERRQQQAALALAKSQAEAANEAKSRFLANMSHEIRTPLNAILGMLALLRRTELSARQADYATKTERAARSLLGLLNDILDFSKVEAGKMTLDAQPLRMDELLRDLGVVLSANLGAKPVEVLFRIDAALPKVLLADAMRLQQVLINLAGNAVKFTHEGEVVVEVRVLRHMGERVRLRFAVHDTGIGIAAQNLARIFSGFTQAEASTTRRYGGSGLGVSISQRLVALMGGELKAHSVPGRGSTFHFEIELPVLAHHETTAAHLPDAAATRRRVLVVDDNLSARDVLAQMCRALGWDCELAASGEAALEQLARAQASFDVVLVDWQMPGLDGWETARRIRDAGLAGTTPLIVMVTAHHRERMEQRSPEDRALLDGYLVKPVTASMLHDALASARSRWTSAARNDAPAAATPQRRLMGLRILVTEDNLNNQQIARELLEDEGAQVQVAQNGQEGVEAVAAAQPMFDLVLMDVQMPVMDGLTATARIRRQLGLHALPIVAMTANAMPSDREACLAAGMNEHVGKPFDLDRLVGVVQRLCARSAAPAQGALPPHATEHLPPAALAAAQAADLDLLAALARLGGRPAVYTRMLDSCVRALEEMQPQFADACRAGDWCELGRQAHTLKGVVAAVGLRELTRLAGAVEREAAAASPPVADLEVQRLMQALDDARPRLLELLAALRDVPEDASARAALAGVDAQALRADIGALLELLEACDMAATDHLAAVLSRAGDALGPRARKLDEAVSALDFEVAAALCRQLIDEVGK